MGPGGYMNVVVGGSSNGHHQLLGGGGSQHHPGSGQPHVNGNSGGPEQDRAKLEKKRERNRIAATKCRQRKLEKISALGTYMSC